MQIYWGVRPIKTATEASTDKIIEHALVVSEHAGFVEEGDTVIFLLVSLHLLILHLREDLLTQ